MRIYIYILNPLSLALVANIACQRQISRRRHITCAVSANIDLLEYLLIRFHSCFTHEYRLPKANITPLGISLAPLAQISIYLLSPHPPSPRRRSPAPRRSRPLFVTLSACHLSRYRESLPHKARQSRAGEGWCVGRRNDSDRQARTKST